MNTAKRNHPFSYYLRRFREQAARAERRMGLYDAGQITDEEAERLMRDESPTERKEPQ